MDAMVASQLDVHAPDASGSSAAQLAACKGHVEVVARLLESGQAKEAKGLSALHLAAQNGLDQVGRVLCWTRRAGFGVLFWTRWTGFRVLCWRF